MKLKLVTYAFVIGLSAMNLSAAYLNFDSTDGATDSSGNLVSPYNGRLNNVAYQLYCGDFTHNINVPDFEVVNVSTIKDLSLTRFGGLSGSTSLYEQVFYLSTLLTMPPAGDTRGDVQDAMWFIFDPNSSPEPSPNRNSATVQGLVTQAQTNYNKPGADYSSFYILTDASNQFNGKQELFVNSPGDSVTSTATPEPGTWAMLLSGIGGIAIARSRRKKA